MRIKPYLTMPLKFSTLLLTALLALCAGVLTACSNGGDSPSPSDLSQVVTNLTTPAKPVGDIVISDYSFAVRAPVRPGQQVSVINNDDASHSVVADENNAFHVRVSGGGGVATFDAPTTPGTWRFHCDYHPNMHGSLTVQ